jgi:tRNA (guanine6-N2)-methyltransferase
MCGSGTLVVERLAAGPSDHIVACDIAPEALDAARANQRTAKLKGRVDYVLGDARALGSLLPAERSAAGFNRLVVNLPWGELVGDHGENDLLYPDVLAEGARLARPDAVLCALTQDIRRFDRALQQVGAWDVDSTWRLFAKGHRPCLYRLTLQS